MAPEKEKLKQYFRDRLQSKLNEQKFDYDVQSGKKISLKNLDEYEKKEEEKPRPKPLGDKSMMFNNSKLMFVSDFKNGLYTAIGSNGHIIKSKNIDDLNRQLAQVFKISALKEGKEPVCRFHLNEHATDKTKWLEAFARNFINAGVVIKGDVPKSNEFWQKMKSDYLSKEGHNEATWNRLTRFVPGEYKRAPQQKNISVALTSKGKGR